MTLPMFPPSGGALSPYLVGRYHKFLGVPNDNKPEQLKVESKLFLINPMSKKLGYRSVMFSSGGFAESCQKGTIPPNALEQISIQKFEVGDFLGVVKIVSFAENMKRVQPGLVGYMHKRYFRGHTVPGLGEYWEEYLETETPLIQIPNEVLDDGELKIILAACP
jgi:hypothetical protein